MASQQQGSHSSGQSEEIIELPPQGKQKSDSHDLANTLVELNQSTSHMGMMLGDLWQKSQDKTLPSQQTAVDESQQRRNGIEIIDIECVLLSFFSENFVFTKWRIYKGIFGSSRLLRKGISRGREECDCFFLSNKVYKKR